MIICAAAIEPSPIPGRLTTGTHGAVTRDALDMRERLQKADALQSSGKIDEAVTEMLAVAALYVARSVPNKALAVLRTAVRLRPEDPDVRISYGEVLQQQRMNEDAAREFLTACRLYEGAGKYGEWIDVMRMLLSIDPDNLTGRLQLAEAQSRAARYEEAARTLRELAEMLRKRGATEDWEKVAERLVHHEAGDVSIAHELALHYVRSGRHAEALAKLIVCYESVPGDAEMLDLIIETLESLGQREKAAIICRELVRTFRRTGLDVEANRALLRLHALAPDDAEARAYVGVLKPAMAIDTVIELEVGTTVPARRSSTTVKAIPLGATVQPGARRPSAPTAAAVRSTAPAAAPFPFPTVAPPSVAVTPRPKPNPTQTTVDLPPTVPLDALPPSAPRVQSPRGAAATVSPSMARGSSPVAIAAARGSGALAGVTLDATERALTLPSAMPLPAQHAGRVQSPSPDARRPPVSLQVGEPIELTAVAAQPHWEPAQPASNYALATPLPALEALAATLAETPSRPDSHWSEDEEDEAGFEVEERTLVEAAQHTPSAPLPPALAMPRPAAPLLEPMRTSEPPATPAAAEPSPARDRGGVLPRPRLARRVGTMTELPSTVRDVSKDIGTLEFFIERGFYESAVALYDALLKRHPNNAELQSYRARIDRMARG